MAILNMLAPFFVLLFLMSLVWKFSPIVFKIALKTLSFPLYMSMFAFEMVFYKILYDTHHTKNIFRLDLPTDKRVRMCMDFVASISVLSYILVLWTQIDKYKQYQEYSKIIIAASNGTLLSTGEVYFIYLPIVIVYLISRWLSPVDVKSPYDKIRTLSIPSMWKEIYNDFVKK